MNVIILGGNSDIGRNLENRYVRDGHTVTTWVRKQKTLKDIPWDLLIVAIGTQEPIGRFFDCEQSAWDEAVWSNVTLPLYMLRELYPTHNPGASVIFFSGAGSNGPAPNYSAYCASKVMLIKLTELLDDEEKDCKFIIIGPGKVKTKMHQQTLKAKEKAGKNYELVRDYLASPDPGSSHDEVYECINKCVSIPKSVIGGKNISLIHDGWQHWRNAPFVDNDNIFKLRRFGN